MAGAIFKHEQSQTKVLRSPSPQGLHSRCHGPRQPVGPWVQFKRERFCAKMPSPSLPLPHGEREVSSPATRRISPNTTRRLARRFRHKWPEHSVIARLSPVGTSINLLRGRISRLPSLPNPSPYTGYVSPPRRELHPLATVSRSSQVTQMGDAARSFRGGRDRSRRVRRAYRPVLRCSANTFAH